MPTLRRSNLFASLRDTISLGWKQQPFQFSTWGTGTIGAGLWGNGGWGSRVAGSGYDYVTEAGRRYDNSVVWAAILWISRAFNEANLQVQQKNAEGKWEGLVNGKGPEPLQALNTLLANPNPYYDTDILCCALLLSYLTWGNAYCYKVRSGAGRVVQLLYIPHTQIVPYVPRGSNEWIEYYAYYVNGKVVRLEVDDVIHLRHGMNPEEQRLGLAPLQAVLREICTENEAATFSAALLRNSGVAGIIFSPKPLPNGGTAKIEKDQGERLKLLWKERTSGDRRGEPWVSSLPVDVTNPAWSPEQLVLDKVRSIPVSRICAVLGVDAMVVGLPSDTKTYSNMIDAREGAYENAVIPLWKTIARQLTLALLPDFVPNFAPNADIRIGFDISEVQALQADMDALWKRVGLAFTQGWLKRKDALRIAGEDYDEKTDDVFITDVQQAGALAISRTAQEDQPDRDPAGNPQSEADDANDRDGARKSGLLAAFKLKYGGRSRQRRLAA